MIYECTENVNLKSIARRAWKKGFEPFALIAHVDRWRRPLVWRLLPQFCLHLWQYCLTPWQLQTMLLMLIIKRVEVDSIDGISVIYHRICFPLRFPACGNMYIKNLWNNIVLQACVFMKSVAWMSRLLKMNLLASSEVLLHALWLSRQSPLLPSSWRLLCSRWWRLLQHVPVSVSESLDFIFKIQSSKYYNVLQKKISKWHPKEFK